ncbi:MAG: SDR family NAD(P)-dependent oxidoreductase [Melioribacteraceae bacterium]|nr:SDR family NAD(P)-dependent oxidoreductase [Melioribacteraceae bacterium]
MACVKRFAILNAEIILLCRNKEKAKKMIEEVKKVVPKANLFLIICDLSSFSSVRNFIGVIKKRYDNLDVLINNAAVMKQKRTLTGDGFETMFQVNFLSPVLLMKELAPLLAKSNYGHIINITLPSSKLRLDFNNMQFEKSFKSFDAFFKTKLALLLYSLKIARNSAFNNIKITCAVPNTKPFKSDLGRDAPFFIKFIKNLISVPVEEVTENMVYLLEHGIKNRKTGEIINGKTSINPTIYWQDEKIQERVYELANSYVKEFSV